MTKLDAELAVIKKEKEGAEEQKKIA